ncbi:hypothetical protein pdam_00011044 [Pocillopora damicornis]|uniref:CXXC-type zinc finger protein 1 n=1 Tax=Pocillopora damicornis TaxID=46731 RepID=A0A3M6TX48_POCDA|nr:hypothetical protein pdam_00011044 [Pocillopora damicornis]
MAEETKGSGSKLKDVARKFNVLPERQAKVNYMIAAREKVEAAKQTEKDPDLCIKYRLKKPKPEKRDKVPSEKKEKQHSSSKDDMNVYVPCRVSVRDQGELVANVLHVLGQRIVDSVTSARRIQEILPQKMVQWQKTTSVADIKAEEYLQKLAKKKEEAQEKLMELDRLSNELDAFIEKTKHATIEESEAQDTEVEGETDLQVHCITCGLPLAPKVALRHMEKCYMKNESLTTFGSIYKSAGNLFCDYYNHQQKIYCKRLRVLCPEHTKEPKISATDVCGCPLVTNVFEETGDFCRASKRRCMKHYCWEKLRRAEIDLQRIQQWLKLEEAFEQERSLRYAAAQRGGVLGLLLHETTCHE